MGKAFKNQVRPATPCGCGNIAEFWQKRRYVAQFVSKLNDADGEQVETQHWLDTSIACEYISVPEHEKLLKKCKDIGNMLGKMMQEPKKWCARFTNK
jgi:four helix bundle protein